ncbi:MAG: MMPL family transporter, partial [Oscillibacter sp.]|nr:MMPL family transporter [Oscillibacter sp.]
MLGEISFISNSVAVVLQLALAIDYAIILCRRYTEEREHRYAREAVVTALAKAIPEISGSSLTTLSGLGAMCFMKFGIGMDLGVVLMKAIVLSLLSVFTLMPGLLMSFSEQIDRSHHRIFVPKITALGRFAVATRFFMPPLFVVILAGAFWFSNHCPYVYGMTTLSTIRVSESRTAQAKVDGTFGGENQLAVLVPAGDYQKEGRLLEELGGMEGVQSAMGLANIEAMDGYVLTDRLTPRQFAELAGLDIEAARLIYSAYALDQGSYGQILSGLDGFGVPLIDMFLFVHQEMETGSIQLGEDVEEKLDDLSRQLTDAKKQLSGTEYSRLVLNLDLPEEGAETTAFLEQAGAAAAKAYPGGAILVGNSTSDRDLASSFEKDNILISILTIVFVILVLVFTFQSAGLPVLLIVVIQGSVWINFSFPYLTGTNLFFLSYLVVSSIQMGANIDYAIVIAGRYTELKKAMAPKDAVVEALNEAFPTIVTSGTILAAAGALIGVLSTNPSISSIGICLGRGTAISIFLVLFILPQILLLGDTIIEKTAFTMKAPVALQLQRHAGTLLVDGRIRGYVSGIVDAEFNGLLRGTIDASVSGGSVTLASADGAEYAVQPPKASAPVAEPAPVA